LILSLMQTRNLVIWITFLAVFAMAATFAVDTDTWWHLRAGEWMVENRQILQVDHFSHTRAGAPWRYPGWLVEIAMYLLFDSAGPGGLNLWTAGMVTLAFAFVWRVQSGNPYLRAFITILGAAASGVYWAARPYLVTFVLTAVFLWILESWRWRESEKNPRRLWLLPVLMVGWANSHGGFFTGFLLLAVYLAGEGWDWLSAKILARRGLQPATGAGDHLRRLRMLGAVSLVTLLAACLSPVGPRLLLYPFQTVEIASLQAYIQEWQPPDFHNLSMQPFLWLFLLSLGAIGASRRRLALTDFLLLAGFGYLGFLAARNIALFALAALPPLSRHSADALQIAGRALRLKPLETQTPPHLRRLNLALVGLVGVAVLARALPVLPATANEDHFRQQLPVAAAQAVMQAAPEGNLFNSYNYGGYLVWALRDYPVFVDGRTDLYSDEIISEWLAAVRAEPGWEEILDRREIGVILIEPETPLTAVLAGQPGWEELYRDEIAVVYRQVQP
ncbi:MAG TPA: hypothetical protein VN363_08320, partial [Anaerolineales bacterium]|nr:hypothetical protein [Anaerolineales bacterium]